MLKKELLNVSGNPWFHIKNDKQNKIIILKSKDNGKICTILDNEKINIPNFKTFLLKQKWAINKRKWTK